MAAEQIESLPRVVATWTTRRLGRRYWLESVIVPWVVMGGLWELAALIVRVARGVPFPTPYDTLVRAFELLKGEPFLDHTIYAHLWASLGRWGLGFLLAAAVGVLVGILCGGLPRIGRICTPIVTILQPIPSLAWIPVAILLLGLGPASTLLIIFLAGVFPVILNTAAGVRSVDEGFLRAAEMMGADQGTVFRRVLIPGAFPHMLSGFRTALANGWRSLIAAEMLTGSGTGLGYAIFQARWNLDYSSAFVNILLIALAGLICEGLVFTQLERRTVERWGLLRRER